MKSLRPLTLIACFVFIALAATSPGQSLTGDLRLQRTLELAGVTTPSQITSDQNNYSPTGLGTSTTLRLSSDAARNLTGLLAGNSGRVLIVQNIGSFPLVLINESSASTAANRFTLAADDTIAAGTGRILAYDATSSRWRVVTSRSSPWGSITGTLSAQSDLNSALAGKEASITAGTTAQYWRGDKSWQTLDTITGLSTTGLLKRTGVNALAIATSGTDYEVPLTFSTGLTRTVNTIAVNASQNISTLSNLTSNGFVKTSGGTGALTIDTSIYLTLTGSGSGLSGIPTSIIGTAGQVAASASTGAVTLSLPTALTGINSIMSAALSNLTLGTGTSGAAATIKSATNSLLLGTTTDSSNGRLQLATHTTSAGGIGFGTDWTLSRIGASSIHLGQSNAANDSMLRIDVPSPATGNPILDLYATGVVEFQIGIKSSDGTLRIDAGGAALGINTKVKFDGVGSGTLAVYYTTASSSTSTGALTVAGGIGVAGNIYGGGGVSSAGPHSQTAGTSPNLFTGGISSSYSASGGTVFYVSGGGYASSLIGFQQTNVAGSDSMVIGQTGAAYAGSLASVGNNQTFIYVPNKLVVARGTGATQAVSFDGSTFSVLPTTAASSSTVGALVVGNGTAATSVAVGGGNINLGGSLTVGGPSSDKVTTLTYASPTSVTVTSGNVFTVTTVNATGSVTFNASGTGTSGQHMELIIINDATSGKTITFGTNFKSSGTLTGIPSKTSTIRFTSDGTSWWETSRVTGTL